MRTVRCATSTSLGSIEVLWSVGEGSGPTSQISAAFAEKVSGSLIVAMNFLAPRDEGGGAALRHFLCADEQVADLGRPKGTAGILMGKPDCMPPFDVRQ